MNLFNRNKTPKAYRDMLATMPREKAAVQFITNLGIFLKTSNRGDILQLPIPDSEYVETVEKHVRQTIDVIAEMSAKDINLAVTEVYERAELMAFSVGILRDKQEASIDKMREAVRAQALYLRINDSKPFIAAIIEAMFAVDGSTLVLYSYTHTILHKEYDLHENGFEVKASDNDSRVQLNHRSQLPWDWGYEGLPNKRNTPKALIRRVQNISDLKYGLPRDLSTQPFDIFRLTALAQGQAVQW